MGRITSFSKQVIVFFLVTALIIRPTFASNVGGWSMGNPVAQGASTVYQGTKNVIINGADYIKKGTAKITPPASSVAKVLARGAAGYALSVAVEQLLGSVDWVLDPANNRIKYTQTLPPNPNQNWNQYNYRAGGAALASSAQAACSNYSSERLIYLQKQSGYTNEIVSVISCPTPAFGDQSKQAVLELSYVHNSQVIKYQEKGQILALINPSYDGTQADEEEKYLPLDVVAQKVISNAEAGDTNAQVATTAAAADIVAEAETDNTKARPIVDQLNNSASTSPANSDANANANIGTGSVANPNTADPDAPPLDLTLKFPIFCSWAPTVCEAAQVVISFPQTLTEWWETGKTKAEEWALSISEAWSKVKEEYNEKPTENTDTQLDLPDQSDPNINTDLSFGGSCPASMSVPVSFFGIHTEIEFSFQRFCEVAAIAKPVIISISAFASALIVAGVRTEDD